MVCFCKEVLALRFSDPLYLLLFIPVLAGLVYSYPKVRGMVRSRKNFSFLVRLCLFACLIFALSGIESFQANQGLCTIFLLDRSDSIRDADRLVQQQFLADATKTMAPDDSAGVIVFGKDASVEAIPSQQFHPSRILSVVDGSSTDISGAIRLATASFPDGKSRRIVVLSDGNETAGDGEAAALVAGAEGIPIDYVGLGGSKSPQIALGDLRAPNESSVGQPFQLRVSAESNVATEGVLTVDRDGLIVKRLAVTISPGENTFSVDQTLDESGFHRYRAVLSTAADGDVRNKIAMGFVSVRGKPKVLILQSNPTKSLLGDALREQKIDVDVRGPGGIPSRPEQLQDFDAVILNDLNAQYVTPQQMALLKSAVKDTGVGFAMVGGEDSFLPGGWYGTTIAETLPVDLEIRKRESFPSTSVLIICDTSGSMGMIEDGVPKVKLAAKAAAMTIQMLPSDARAGVVASTDGIEFVASMQELRDKPTMMAEAMRMDVGGGGIYAKPSMDFAISHLEAEPSKVRHLILMADGSDVDLRDGCYEIAAKMRAEHITTSTVAIGDGEYVPFLRGLAAVGGGRFYLALKGSQLPAVFTQDAAVVARSAIEEGAFLPKVSLGEEILRGIDVDSLPPLLAYDLTDTKPLARVGMRTQKDDPLLAVWQYGLGTSLAFTSDAQARWAAKWVGWPGFGVFWAQAVREIGRRASSNTYRIQTHLDGAKGVVELAASDATGNPLNQAPSNVRISTPNGTAEDVTLTQVAPGKFTGSFAANEIGSYIATVAEKSATGLYRVSSSGFSVPYPAEYRRFQTNEVLLHSLSEDSGGKPELNAAEAFRGAAKPGYSIQELWMLMIAIACCLLPFDIASRRIAIPIGEAFAKGLSWIKSRRAKQIVVPENESVARLHKAKQRAGVMQADGNERPVDPIFESSKPGAQVQKATPPPAPISASARLLESKRKRKE